MEMPLSELADRLTILRLKVERLPEDNTMAQQFSIFNAEVCRQLSLLPEDDQEKIKHEISELYRENANTWDLEFEIRQGDLDNDLAEVGRRALLIRQSNKRRIKRKNTIARLSSNMIMWDKKVDHGSE